MFENKRVWSSTVKTMIITWPTINHFGDKYYTGEG